MRRTSAQTRELVLQVAGELFYRDGIRATGVDRIAAEAGVAATTLYRLFASKDDLVAAYVDRSADRYRRMVEDVMAAAGPDPYDRLLAVFAAVVAQNRGADCRGCAFQLALGETPDPSASAHRLAAGVKEWTRALLADLVERLADDRGVPVPALLVDHLMLILEGIYASVPSLGIDGPAARSGDIVRHVVDSAFSDG